MQTTSTNQLLMAIWRASRAASVRSLPTVATNTGAVASGLMIGSNVIGTRMSAFRNATTSDSMAAVRSALARTKR